MFIFKKHVSNVLLASFVPERAILLSKDIVLGRVVFAGSQERRRELVNCNVLKTPTVVISGMEFSKSFII